MGLRWVPPVLNRVDGAPLFRQRQQLLHESGLQHMSRDISFRH